MRETETGDLPGTVGGDPDILRAEIHVDQLCGGVEEAESLSDVHLGIERRRNPYETAGDFEGREGLETNVVLNTIGRKVSEVIAHVGEGADDGLRDEGDLLLRLGDLLDELQGVGVAHATK